MTVVLTIVWALLVAAALLTLLRLVHGPSMLDRAVALDVLVAVMMAGLGVGMISAGEHWELVTMLVLSLVGFTGSTGIARFMIYRDQDVEGDR
ncbi:monovalent cation/H+ antiporter complex subunit F [Actinomadura atramentaria]|uniref:monovalent cation/H+ antiporter complex subunit F n=1 Tax=Actinomadura atramentaria TaxID=1990 RepID=UPI00036A2C81|nr:monovalent cation/H+ antiporter complex subunit F [Actinomadura atramentaria]